MSNHDLTDFIEETSKGIESEYRRIQKRSMDDPGTAGDQGEENWASLLRNWLPPIFQIVTKGKIIDSNGDVSPQVDIIVLKPEYPKALLDKKLYLAGGVLAVFECKNTLRASHLPKFFQAVKNIKNMHLQRGYRDIYDESHSPILVGLLAHSHNWAIKNLVDRIGECIYKNDLMFVTKPIEMPDLFCIADACCWVAKKSLAPHINHRDVSAGECISASYWSDQRIHPLIEQQENIGIPIATALKAIMHRLSKEHAGLRSLSQYFNDTIPETGGGMIRYWPIKEVFSKRNLKEIESIGKEPDYYFPEVFKYL